MGGAWGWRQGPEGEYAAAGAPAGNILHCRACYPVGALPGQECGIGGCCGSGGDPLVLRLPIVGWLLFPSSPSLSASNDHALGAPALHFHAPCCVPVCLFRPCSL